MKRTLLLVFLAVPAAALAQGSGDAVFIANPVQVSGAAITARGSSPSTVLGAPYSATITNQTVQTLADGNRIVQSTTGTIARDSQGRTRQDIPLPALGPLAPANLPHIVMIQDPVGQAVYTLNLTAKTAQKLPLPGIVAGSLPTQIPVNTIAAAPLPPAGASDTFFFSAGALKDGAAPPPASLPGPVMIQSATQSAIQNAGPVTPSALPGPVIIQNGLPGDPGAEATEDLGSQTMEGVFVTGTRTTHTIPAGQIGNDRPINIVTEVWTSPDLKTIVYSKRDDPRMGEQTFKLTGVSRAEPDASLFTVPADFQLSDSPQPTVLYRQKQ